MTGSTGAQPDSGPFTAPVDLTNCDREPIHIPGAIQPYGVLLGVDDRSGIIRVASESIEQHLGISPSAAIGSHLSATLGGGAAERLIARARSTVDRGSDRLSLNDRRFDVLVHRNEGMLIIELTPRVELDADPDSSAFDQSMIGVMRNAIGTIEQSESLADIADAIAREMRSLTGFDRVWVYRFHPDWHGEIIGEARRPDIETWMGMHYPASDIPAQARALFLKNWVRVIPDVGFAPSRLTPTLNPLTGVPLNLGNALLRSVSPIHVQYLKNMGVTASLVISLIHQGRLWGLISGHHYSGPRLVSAETRATCEFLAYALSMQVGAAERLIDKQHSLNIRRRQAALVEQLSAAPDIEAAFARGAVTLPELTDADGAAIVRADRVTPIGHAPSKEEIRTLATWVAGRPEPVVIVDALSREFPPAAAYRDIASGLLAIPISADRSEQLLWFRREQRQTVRWAGDPRKPVELEPGGSARLHPRGSFELWEEEVSGTSQPWQPEALVAAEELRRAVLDVLIARAQQLESVNAELQHSVAQLQETGVELEAQANTLMEQRQMLDDALQRESQARQEAERANRAKSDFLAMMSHELRTPLNAIGGYASLLTMGLRGPVTQDQQTDLARIETNQRHLLGLINNILNFAKVEAGAVPFNMANVEVQSTIASLEPLVQPQMAASALTFAVRDCPDDLVVRADEEKLRQILINLLSNALKFTPTGGSVEISCTSTGDAVSIAVRDTGMGIDADGVHRVFEPFVQVHRFSMPNNTDKGTGLGLSISRELARAMEGDLTVTSQPGVGSTFTLRLPRVAGPRR